MRPGPRPRSLRERIADKYVVDPATGCWLWTAFTDGQGYGQIRKGGLDGNRLLKAHRAMYELHVGPIPEGLTLDHLCHTNAVPTCNDGDRCQHRRCVNPAHLEPVPQGVNVMRSPFSASGANARKTHCPHGHEYTPENTYRRANRATRECRTCALAYQKARKAA